MSKSNLLRVAEVRDAYRLIGDCRDLGNDPALWHQRLFDGMCRMFGGQSVTGGEGRWRGPSAPAEIISAFSSGFDTNAIALYERYLRHNGIDDDPVFPVVQRLRSRIVTRTRRQLVSDRAWYGSGAFNEYYRAIGIDDRLLSVCQTIEGGTIDVVNVSRGLGERPFSSRESNWLQFLRTELATLIGRSLVSAVEPNPDGLSPRLRQTLACLLEGDTEKQAAARLGISPATLHQYVTVLYRRFHVTSRAQLMAYAMRRQARSGWSKLSPTG
jgi:DNA-binding CsgD family transcriptional regulator